MSTPTRKLPLAGGTMASGANITLAGGGEILGLPATPSATGAASKEYVDGLATAIPNSVISYAAVGTDYSLTNSSAQVSFGTSGNAVLSITTAGTYLVMFSVDVQNDAAGASDVVQVAMRVHAVGSNIITCQRSIGGNNEESTFASFGTYVASGAIDLEMWAYNLTSARGSILNGVFQLFAIRLT